MQFSRLRLSGFKSFVDPTELIISAGLTGVVGPNGCGKSNLLEAIRWVMGESRPTAMRGDGMEDVIFAGSGSRPARNHAEVMLTLDNRDRLAPAGFNDEDTLEIIRRITRDAGSAYRANGKEARARDVAMLFADASTGSQSPSLVRQGQISELINARPKARRRVLEEAAGISGLYQRRHEAELKLRATEANLGRVGDVLEALEAQLTALARQAKQAARYREIAEGLRRAEGLLLYRLWRDAEDERSGRGGVAAGGDAGGRRGAGGGLRGEPAARRGRGSGAAGARGGRGGGRGAAARAGRARADRRGVGGGRAADRGAGCGAEADPGGPRARGGARHRRGGDGRAARGGADRAGGGAAKGTRRRWRLRRRKPSGRGASLKMIEAGFDAKAEAAARLAAEHQAALARRGEAARKAEEAARSLQQIESGLATAEAELDRAAEARGAALDATEEAGAAAEAAEEELAIAEETAFSAREADTEARATLAGAEGAAKALAGEAAGLERLLARPKGATAQILDGIRVRARLRGGAGRGADRRSGPASGGRRGHDGLGRAAGLRRGDAAAGGRGSAGAAGDGAAGARAAPGRDRRRGPRRRRADTGGPAAGAAAGQPRGRPVALGRSALRGRRGAERGGAAAAAGEPARRPARSAG